MQNLADAIASLPGWNASLALLLLKATIILIAALGITVTMPRASATARHLVWLVTLATLLLVPALSAWAPVRVPMLPAAAHTVGTNDTPPASARGLTAAPAGRIDIDSTSGTMAITAPSSRVPVNSALSTASISALSLVFIVWGAVALAIVSSLAWASISVQRIVQRATPLTSPDWQTPLYEIADRLGLDQAPRLGQSEEATMPFACGVLRATIVLPADASVWSLDRRQAVLLHELAHVRRHDLIGHALSRLEALSAALKSDANEKVRATAAWTLGNTGERSAAAALTAALSDQSREVRLRAAWALGSVEPREAPKQLIALLGDSEPRVRQSPRYAVSLNRTIPRCDKWPFAPLAGGHATGPWPWP